MRIFICLLFLLVSVSATLPAQARMEAIAAVVNQDAITMSDLNDRMHLVMVSSGLPQTEEIATKLSKQVLNDLIEEQLKLQEAKRVEVTVSKEEVEQGFSSLAQQNKFTPDQFRQIIKQGGINVGTMERQIRAQIAWTKVIQKKMRPQVTVTDTDVDDFLERLKNSKGKDEYLASEIFLPVDETAPEADTQQLAIKLVNEINGGKAPFFKVAQQFSRAAGAPNGGDLGWMQQGQLQPELEKALASLEKGKISQPVRSSSGYHILMLRDKRTITDATIPTRENIYNTIGVQRLERMQARQLLELKTTAFIENRVES